METYSLNIKVLVDEPNSIADVNSMINREIEKLGEPEKALPVLTQAFIEMKQMFERNLHINRKGEIIDYKIIIKGGKFFMEYV